MVVVNDSEGGYFILEGSFEVIVRGFGEWGKGFIVDKVKGFDGEVEGLVGGCEYDSVIFLGL